MDVPLRRTWTVPPMNVLVEGLMPCTVIELGTWASACGTPSRSIPAASIAHALVITIWKLWFSG